MGVREEGREDGGEEVSEVKRKNNRRMHPQNKVSKKNSLK